MGGLHQQDDDEVLGTDSVLMSRSVVQGEGLAVMRLNEEGCVVSSWQLSAVIVY